MILEFSIVALAVVFIFVFNRFATQLFERIDNLQREQVRLNQHIETLTASFTDTASKSLSEADSAILKAWMAEKNDAFRTLVDEIKSIFIDSKDLDKILSAIENAEAKIMQKPQEEKVTQISPVMTKSTGKLNISPSQPFLFGKRNKL